MTAPILIVEDDVMQRQMLATLLLRKLNFECIQAENGQQALDILKAESTQNIKLVILDLKMPVMGGMETLEFIHQQYPNLPVIMLSGSRDLEDVVEAMKHGAIDFLNKPFDGERLKVTVQNALKLSTLSNEITLLKNEASGQFKFANLIGHDQGLAESLSIARKAATSDIQVLLTGETGTGKEIFAKAIHGESLRAGQPFVAVNCGAIPAQLVESILFGHEKGAFTGAVQKSLGKFREAEGGTIFLDEVGDLPMDAQVKLLRVLQQKEVEPVGATQAIPVNIRLISATNHDLEHAVKEGKFREDLYFRLNVLNIKLPPLRDRKNDIPLLARHFMSRFCASENRSLKTFSKRADEILKKANWPGNVRQLENTIHRALVMTESTILDAEDFIDFETEITANNEVINNQTEKNINVFNDSGNLKSTEEIEAELIKISLEHFNHNITKASAAIGMAKSTFYKKINNT